MQFKISTASPKKTTILIVNDAAQLSKADTLSAAEISFATSEIKKENKLVSINQYGRFVYVCVLYIYMKTIFFNLRKNMETRSCIKIFYFY